MPSCLLGLDRHLDISLIGTLRPSLALVRHGGARLGLGGGRLDRRRRLVRVRLTVLQRALRLLLLLARQRRQPRHLFRLLGVQVLHDRLREQARTEQEDPGREAGREARPEGPHRDVGVDEPCAAKQMNELRGSAIVTGGALLAPND